MTPRRVVERYVELINAGHYGEVGSLWADDATLYSPDGRVFQGKIAISAFYSSFRSYQIPLMRAVSFTEDIAAKVCAVELETQMSRDESGNWKTDPNAPLSLAALDRFTINNAGKIQHMIAYVAPSNRWLAA